MTKTPSVSLFRALLVLAILSFEAAGSAASPSSSNAAIRARRPGVGSYFTTTQCSSLRRQASCEEVDNTSRRLYFDDVFGTAATSATTRDITCKHHPFPSSPPSLSSLVDDDVELCSSTPSVAKTLARGAFLRIASDLSGGTPFESVKTRVTTTREGPMTAYRNIVNSEGGFFALWTGTQSRIVEGALVGGCFMLTSTLTKAQIKSLGGSPTVAALAGGLVGGVAQAIIMTPAGMIFTTLNYNRGKPGYESDTTARAVVQRILRERGVRGLYAGAGAMCLRQASNWASRAGLTEFARTTLGMSGWGVAGEIGSGILGGLGSCWNTPIESVRITSQRDVSLGRQPKSIMGYWKETIETEGYPALFRGVTPRALQSIWQTIFMVVFPNMMGI